MRKVSLSKLALLRVIGISLLIIVTIFLGLRKNPKTISWFRKTIFPANPVSPQQWILVIRKLYSCGHEESKYIKYQSEKPFKKVIQNHFKQIKKVNNQSYTYVENDQDLCDSCRTNQFLGVNDQWIAVFRGTPGKPGPITEKIPLNLSNLPEAEIKDLKKGIPFQDGKEKLQLLEGLNGLSAE